MAVLSLAKMHPDYNVMACFVPYTSPTSTDWHENCCWSVCLLKPGKYKGLYGEWKNCRHWHNITTVSCTAPVFVLPYCVILPRFPFSKKITTALNWAVGVPPGDQWSWFFPVDVLQVNQLLHLWLISKIHITSINCSSLHLEIPNVILPFPVHL